MFQTKQRLLELNSKLAETLTTKGIAATSDETTTSLINKVSEISGGDDSLLKGLIQRDLTELEISGVKSIGTCAFQRFDTLIRLTTDGVEKIGVSAFERCSNLAVVELKSGLKEIERDSFKLCSSLKKVALPKTLVRLSVVFNGCTNIEDVTLGDGFNCNNLNLSASTLYSRETIVSWLNALADRTGLTTYTLIIGAENLAKLTEEDIAIATVKNWTLA